MQYSAVASSPSGSSISVPSVRRTVVVVDHVAADDERADDRRDAISDRRLRRSVVRSHAAPDAVVVRLGDGESQAFELDDEVVDVVFVRVGVAGAHADLGGTRDQLVESGLGQAEAVGGGGRQHLEPVGAGQLALDRGHRRGAVAGWIARRRVGLGERGELRPEPDRVDAVDRSIDLVAALGDRPALLDGLFESSAMSVSRAFSGPSLVALTA